MTSDRWSRFLRYGAAGWLVEIGFTGLAALLAGDRSATARTYLWMHPIYGAAGLVLDGLRPRLASRRAAARAVPYVGTIYAAEALSGWLLERALGRCPWQYTRGVHVRGWIRLDYLPFWFALALAADPLRDRLNAVRSLPAVPSVSGAVDGDPPRATR